MNVLRTKLRHRLGRVMKAAVLTISMSGLGIANAQRPTVRPPAAAPAASPQPAAATRTMTAQQIAERLKYSTCYIRVTRATGVISGTGWVYDVQKRLIVTNHHVVDGAKKIQVYFPRKQNGQWVNIVSFYLQSVKPATGTVIGSSKVHDLAIVQLDALPSDVRALTLASSSAAPGARLHSIGGRSLGSRSLWIYTYGHVRQVSRGRTALGGITRIVEAQMETNKGNSGGPIVNDAGELVAVVEGHADKERSGGHVHRVRNISTFIDVTAVRSYFAKVLPLVDPQTADQFLARGVANDSADRYSAAIRDFSAAIRRQPRMAAAYAKRGRAFYHKGDHATAIEDFNHAIEIDPTLSEAFLGRGRCNKALKKYTAAIRDFSNAIRFQPENATAYNLRGIVFLKIKQKESAHRDLLQATRLNTNEPVYFYNLGLVSRSIGHYSEAVTAYTRAIKLRSTDEDYFNGLGLSLYSLKQYEKAAKVFLLANVVYKNRHHKYHWVYYENAGMALHRANKLKAAYGAMTKAIELNGTYGKLRYLRGLIAKDLGRQDLASRDFEKAAQLNPKKYGKLTSRGRNGQKRETANGTRQTARHIDENGSGRVAGTWGFRGTLNGRPVRMVSILKPGGTYSCGIRVTQPDGRETIEMESGTYTVDGDRMTMTSRDGECTIRRFGFRDGSMWVYLQEARAYAFFKRMAS